MRILLFTSNFYLLHLSKIIVDFQFKKNHLNYNLNINLVLQSKCKIFITRFARDFFHLDVDITLVCS